MRILLIEDSAVDARLLENVFDGQRAQVETVETLSAGRRKLETEEFDLIFLDLLLPDSRGLEKIAEIQSLAPEAPIVVVTGLEDASLARRALHLGADDFVLKSQWNVSILSRAAHQALDRAHTRKDLLQSERWMKALCSASRDGIMVEQNEAIVFANRACADLFGYGSVGELLGRPVSILCAPHEEQRLLEYGRQRLQGKDAPRIYEFQGRRRDGSLVEAEASVSEFALRRKHYIITMIRNIEERKRAEHSLRQLEGSLRQARQMESIGRLAGGVAHDFNNLLMIIRGYAEIIGESLQGQTHARNIEEILTATNRAAELTRQLLTVGRRQVRRLEAVDLRTAISSFQNSLPGILGDLITVKVQICEAPIVVRIDPDHLNRVLLNLALNARDAMPEGGTLGLELSNVFLGKDELPSGQLATPGRFVTLAVRDTGSGIPADAQPYVFEPFFTTKERGKGTGLGLAMVYAIVKQASGHVVAESIPGQGASFRIWLPLIESEQPLPMTIEQGSMPKELPHGSETVLLVEDEAALRQLASVALEQLGYNVISASGGEAALELAAHYHGQIDVLLTDVIMPGLNGRQVADALCASRPETRVLYMSGYSDQILAQRGCLIPGIELLEKPFTKESLARRLRQVIRGGKK